MDTLYSLAKCLGELIHAYSVVGVEESRRLVNTMPEKLGNLNVNQKKVLECIDNMFQVFETEYAINGKKYRIPNIARSRIGRWSMDTVLVKELDEAQMGYIKSIINKTYLIYRKAMRTKPDKQAPFLDVLIADLVMLKAAQNDPYEELLNDYLNIVLIITDNDVGVLYESVGIPTSWQPTINQKGESVPARIQPEPILKVLKSRSGDKIRIIYESGEYVEQVG